MVKPAFPNREQVGVILEEAVLRCYEGLSPPDEISKVYEWLGDEGLDELLKASEDLIGVSIDEMSKDQFNDRNLRDWLGLPSNQKVDDEERINFIIERISEEGFESLGGDYFPSVVKYPIVSKDGRAALIGGYALISGHGPEFTWLGVFSDESHFYEHLKNVGIRLPSELLGLSPAELLTWWRKGRR